jgi:hypothetical protein
MCEDIIDTNTNVKCCEAPMPTDVSCCIGRPQSMIERLVERKKRTEQELEEINTAIDAISASKEVYNAINAITRVFGNNIR